jgi:tetratricopeptide (TPR) repeat protein
MPSEPPSHVTSVADDIFRWLVGRAVGWEQVEPVAGVADLPIFASTAGLLDLITSHAATPDLSGLRVAASNGDPRALTMLLRLVGLAQQALKQWHEAAGVLWKAHKDVELVESSGPLADLAEAAADEGSIISCRIYQARAYYRLGLEPEAEAAYRRAIYAAGLLPNPDPAELALCYVNLGVLLTRGAREDEALVHFDRALELDSSMPTVVNTCENKASALEALGRFGEAANLHLGNLRRLEDAGIHGHQLAIVLDNLAELRMATGDSDQAMPLLKRAAGEFAADDLKSQAVNKWRQARAARDLHQLQDSAEAFTAAHDLLLKVTKAELPAEHFREGFDQARAHRAAASSPVWRELAQVQRADFTTAQAMLAAAADQARDVGDVELALRCQANVATALAAVRDIDGAFALCTQVDAEAMQLGYAVPALMVWMTKASLIDSGSDSREEQGVLGIWLRCRALADLHRAICTAAGVNPDEPAFSVSDPGQIDRGLAMLAAEFYANELALSYFQAALDKAGDAFSRVNGLTGMLEFLTRDRSEGTDKAAATVAAALESLLSRQDLSSRLRLDAHRVLGSYLGSRDAAAAIQHLRLAAGELERLRTGLPPGPGRANLDAQYPVYPLLRRLLEAAGDDASAFETLQCERGRRLAESLTAASGDQRPYQPPGLTEAKSLIAQVGPKAALVDLTVNSEGVKTRILTADGLQCFDVTQPTPVLVTAWRAMWGDVRQRAVDALRIVSESPLFADIAQQVVARLDTGSTILLTVDDALANLPLHIASVNGQAWCDVMPICRLPALGVLRFTPPSRVWSGKSLVAGDSRDDLPGAAAECRQAASRLGAQPLIGESCTLTAVRETLTKADLDIVHLAVHGRGDYRRGGRASLLFANGSGGMEWAPFDELAQLPFHCDLIVLSGCSTAVGGPRNGSGLYGVAEAAAEAGAVSVIASLWPVGDTNAATFMATFYDELARLRTGPDTVIDLRRLVDRARSALRKQLAPPTPTPPTRRDGRELGFDDEDGLKSDDRYSDMMDWAAFVVLGDPMLRIA